MVSHTPYAEACGWFAGVDVYLLDLLLRGRVGPSARVLDAGCGAGRNLTPFLRSGCDVHAFDASQEAVGRARERFAALAPHLPPGRARVATIEDLQPSGDFDLVLAVAVLHFARDAAHFDALVARLWGAVAPGGLLYTRLAARTGVEDVLTPLGGGRYRQGDGDERFVIDPADLPARTTALGGVLAEPLKTVVVHGKRAMTTWVIERPRGGPAQGDAASDG